MSVTKNTTQRFIDFHLGVAVYAERANWVLSKLDPSQEGVDLLEMLLEDLERLIDSADCRVDEHTSSVSSFDDDSIVVDRASSPVLAAEGVPGHGSPGPQDVVSADRGREASAV